MELSLIIDIVLVGLVVIFAIIGLIKGFFKTFLSFFGTVVSLVISILLAKTVANALIQIGFINKMFGGDGIVSGWISNGLVKLHSGVFNTAFTSQSSAELANDLTGAGIPGFLAQILAGPVSKLDFTGKGLTLAQILAPALANMVWLIVVTFLLFAILRFVMALLNKLFKSLTKNKAINGLNRLFGFIVGALKGAVVAACILLVSALLSSAKFMTPYNEALDKTVIAKPLNGVVYEYVGKNIDLDKILGDLLQKTTTEQESTTETAEST